MHARIMVVVMALMALAIPVLGAQSYLGSYNGLIIVPDAYTTPAGTWDFAAHDLLDVLDNGDDIVSLSVIYGITPAFEVGASFVNNDESDVAFSGKYQIFPETASRPAVAIGVFDLFSMAEWITNDASFYILASKNLIPVASEATTGPAHPLYLTAGFGSGLFDGFFGGIDWVLAPQLSLQAEFLNEGFNNDSEFNAGLRYAVSNQFRLDAGTIDFSDFAFGLSFRTRL